MRKKKKYNPEYYLANKEKIQTKQREYRENNKDKIKEINRKYYQEKKKNIVPKERSTNKKDLSGMIFSKLEVIKETSKRYREQILWECKCKCGNIVEIPGYSLRVGYSKSCGKCSRNIFYEKDNYIVGVTTKNKEFYFSKEDFIIIKKHSWWMNHDGYVCGVINNKHTTLHRFIMNFPNGLEVDHVNNIRHDNRRENLRIANDKQNQWNSSKRRNTTSKYKGVSWDKEFNKWRVRITDIEGKRISCGRFESEDEAGMIYNKKAEELFGEFAKLNKIRT